MVFRKNLVKIFAFSMPQTDKLVKQENPPTVCRGGALYTVLAVPAQGQREPLPGNEGSIGGVIRGKGAKKESGRLQSVQGQLGGFVRPLAAGFACFSKNTERAVVFNGKDQLPIGQAYAP